MECLEDRLRRVLGRKQELREVPKGERKEREERIMTLTLKAMKE